MSKAFVIDPHARTVTEIDMDGYQGLKAALDNVLLDMVRLDQQMHVVYLDDDGMAKKNQAFFRIPAYPKPLAGKAVISRIDNEGDECSVLLSLEEVKNMVTFVDTKVVDTVTTQKTVHGVFFMSTEVIFEPETVLPHAE